MTAKKFLHPGDPSTRSVSTCPGGRTLRLPHAVAGQARLASLLWPYRALESESDVARLLTPPGAMRATVSSGMHDAICRLYDDLWDQPPPEDSLAERAAATAARAPAAGDVWPVRGHRTATTVRATAITQLSRQGMPHGAATA